MNLGSLVRIDEGKETEETSESIPKTGVGKHLAFVNLPVVRTAMYSLAVGGDLRNIPREENAPVETGVEGPQIVDVSIFDLDTPQEFIPAGTPLVGQLFERFSGQFIQVDESLFDTDKGSGNFQADLLALSGFEAYKSEEWSPSMVFTKSKGVSDSMANHRLNLWPRRRCSGPNIRLSCFRHQDGRAAVKGIHDQIGSVPFRIRDPEHCGALGRNKFQEGVVFGKINAVEIRFGALCLV